MIDKSKDDADIIAVLGSLQRTMSFLLSSGALLAAPGGTTGAAGRKRPRSSIQLSHSEAVCSVDTESPRNRLAFWLREQGSRAQTKRNRVSGRNERGEPIAAEKGSKPIGQLFEIDQPLLDAIVGCLAGASEDQLGLGILQLAEEELSDRFDDVRLAYLTAIRNVAAAAHRNASSKGASGRTRETTGESKKKARRGQAQAQESPAPAPQTPSEVASQVLARADPEWVAIRLVQLLQGVQLPADDEEWGERTFAVESEPASSAASAAASSAAAAKATEEAAKAEARRRAKRKPGTSASMAELEEEEEAERLAAASAKGKGKGKGAGGRGGKGARRAALLTEHRAMFEQAWLAVLRLPLPPIMLQRILKDLPNDILPHFARPLQLADFLRAVVASAPRYKTGWAAMRRALKRPSDGSGAVASRPLSSEAEVAAADSLEEIELGDEDEGSPHGREAAVRATCGVLAVRSLFVLVRRHGLQHPKFFDEMYSMLTPAMARCPARQTYFQVLAMFLKSAGLPAYLVAAFAKRLCRLAIRIPEPGVALFALPQVFNLVSKHPVLTPMIHRGEGARGRKEAVAAAAGTVASGPASSSSSSSSAASTTSGHDDDPFAELEDDPAKCCAIESQLWELVALREHWHPMVAARAAVFERDLARPPFEAARFAGESYEAILARHGEQLRQSITAQRDQDAGSMTEAGLGAGSGAGSSSAGGAPGAGPSQAVGSSLLRQLGVQQAGDGGPMLGEGESMDENGLIAFAQGLSAGDEAQSQARKQMLALMQAAKSQLGGKGRPTYGRRKGRTFGGIAGTPVSQFPVGGIEAGEVVPAVPTERAALRAGLAGSSDSGTAAGGSKAQPMLVPEVPAGSASEQLESIREAVERAQEGVLPLQLEGLFASGCRGAGAEASEGDGAVTVEW